MEPLEENKEKKLKEIKEKKLLLVEGKDEEVFFKIFLEKKNIKDIQIMSSGGKQQFQTLFPAIKKAPNFDEVSSLAIIQDADTDAKRAFQSICSVLKNNGMKAPDKISSFVSNAPRIGVFIIPDGKNEGQLESLCLSTVKSKGLIKCIVSFMDCIEENLKESDYKFPKNTYKAKCRAFLSAMETDTPSLGVAAEKGYWNFDSEELNPLLDFLKQL